MEIEREEMREWDKGGVTVVILRGKGVACNLCFPPLVSLLLFPSSCFPFLFCSIQPLFIPSHFLSDSSLIIFTFLALPRILPLDISISLNRGR